MTGWMVAKTSSWGVRAMPVRLRRGMTRGAAEKGGGGGAGDAGQVTAGDDQGVGEDGRAGEPDRLDRGQLLRLRWREGGTGRDGGHAALRAGRGARGVVASGAARSSSPVLRPVSARKPSSSEG